MKVACRNLAVALLLLLGAATLAEAKFAAICYSPQTGKWGSSYNYDNLAAAQNDALDRCGTIDARLAIWVENGYAALARSKQGVYGWAWSATSRADAEERARKFAGDDAVIVCWVFSGT